tara:strand:+ start:11627 stop:12259 length:633 start_codon:yes stop_codon:yes gene_type:complete
MYLNPLNIIQRSSACGGLDMGSGVDCDDPIVAGVDQRLVLINKDIYDRATVVENVSIPNLIDSIVLTQTGDSGFAFQGIRKSLNPQSAYVPAAVSQGFDHQVDFLIFDIGQAQKNNIEKMTGGKFVAIIQNSSAAGNKDAIFEVFGKDVGLTMQASPMRINGDLETNGAYTIALKTSDDFGKEPHLPSSYNVTDFAGTLVQITTILTPVV